MNILIITQGIYPYAVGGAEVNAYYHAKNLATRGHNVFVFIPKSLKTEEIGTACSLKTIQLGIPKRLLSILSFIISGIAHFSLIRDSIEVVHAQVASTSSLLSFLLSVIYSEPYVVACRGSEILVKKPWTMKVLQRITLQKAAMVTVVSNELRHVLITEYKVPKKKIILIPNGYDDQLIKSLISTEAHPADRYVVFVGRLELVKGVTNLLEAFRAFVSTHHDVKLTLVGQGRLLGRLKKIAKNYGLEHYVHFLGKLSHEETMKVVSNSDLFVLPSLSEGLPISLIEAMALGKPVVATAVGGIRDVIKDGFNGLLVPPNSPKRLAQAMENVLSSKGVAEYLGRNAAKSVEAYSWQQIVSQYEHLYQTVIKREKCNPHLL